MAKRKNTIRKIGKAVVSFDGDGERRVAPPRTDRFAGEGVPSLARGPPSARLLTPEETADFLHCSTSALAKWRCAGCGPRYALIGSRVRYRFADIVAFVDNRARTSTSQEAPAA
jgi:hypothetical protein